MNASIFSSTLAFITILSVSSFYSSSEINYSQQERQLYKLVNQYRKSKGLKNIPLSPALTFVAQTHAKDVIDNISNISGNCNLHSWSKNEAWSACCYTPDHQNATGMWSKPKELTNYPGKGYEISFFISNEKETIADEALDSWKSSEGHNDVIINQKAWSHKDWNAIGIGIHKGYACIWFGTAIDQ